LLLCVAFVSNACARQTPKKSAVPAKAGKIAFDASDPGEFVNFTQWKEVAAFIDQMAARHGFDKAELETIMSKTRYVERAIQLVKPAPPSQPKNWAAYRARFVEPVRINAGVAFWNEYTDALARAENEYGVPAEIIVGILGVETIFGRNTGNFRVLDAITTLAFAYPNTPTRTARMEYFRGELESALLLARDAGIDPFSLLGSYAGAIGWPQFMPGSILRYAVDFDGDGKSDLHNSPIDAIGSIASFLAQHGWQRGEPIAFPAKVNQLGDSGNKDWQKFIGKGLEAKFSLGELKASGVAAVVKPPAGLLFGLVDLQNGLEPTEYWLGTANFFAIARYNRSFFYAMSVVDLGRAVSSARNLSSAAAH
jgi:membrane-bound lytic murein transglycosylase B